MVIIISIPAVILNENTFDSVAPVLPPDIVLDCATVPAVDVQLMVCVPVVVKFVRVVVSHITMLPDPVRFILPVPKAITLEFEFVLEKIPQDNNLLFRSNVPFVKVIVLVVPSVKSSPN